MTDRPFTYYGDGDVKRFRYFRGVEFAVLEGSGEKGDPFRTVIYFFHEDGQLIARIDHGGPQPGGVVWVDGGPQAGKVA